jgi:SAM-dependent methyltransferase
MPYNHKVKKPGEDPRKFDTTSCTQASHGTRVHRDYAAHFFRWGFAHRFIRAGMRVLDVGCGRDQPMPRILTDKMSHVPKLYLGVDFDDVKPRYHFQWIQTIPSFDFTKRWKELKKKGPFNVVLNFEVIEHMHKASGRKLLAGVRELLAMDGTFLLSTPCYDGRRMANNHIHEYKIEELQKEIEKAGLRVDRRYGTFMDVKHLKRVTIEHQRVARDLRGYYGDEVMSCFLAPLYPDYCRNNLWVLRKGKP